MAAVLALDATHMPALSGEFKGAFKGSLKASFQENRLLQFFLSRPANFRVTLHPVRSPLLSVAWPPTGTREIRRVQARQNRNDQADRRGCSAYPGSYLCQENTFPIRSPKRSFFRRIQRLNTCDALLWRHGFAVPHRIRNCVLTYERPAAHLYPSGSF